MKLMNREPTEEMIKAGREFQGVEGYTACEIRNIYRDMYDAANEIATNSEPIVQDMEPVAYGYRNKNLGWYGCSLSKGGSYTEPDSVPLYSAEQVATLQAENEELKDRNKQGAASADIEITMLVRELADITADRDHWKELSHEDYWKQVQKLTAERDELLECGMELILEAEEYEFDDGMGKGALMQSWNDFEAVASRIKSKIAKHEGEKHNLPAVDAGVQWWVEQQAEEGEKHE